MDDKCRSCGNIMNDMDIRCRRCGHCDADRLIVLLRHPETEVRLRTVDAFSEVVPNLVVARAIVAAIEDEQESVRRAAAITLFTLRSLSRMVVPELVELLGSTDGVVQRLIVACLSNAGDAARIAIPSLLSLQQSTDDGLLREWISEALRATEDKTAG
jgi:HEAT repeat protein